MAVVLVDQGHARMGVLAVYRFVVGNRISFGPIRVRSRVTNVQEVSGFIEG